MSVDPAFIISSNQREVLLRFETYSVWKKSSEVTLDEYEMYGTGEERWGNSEQGFVFNNHHP